MENKQLAPLDAVDDLENMLLFYGSMINVSKDIFYSVQRSFVSIENVPKALLDEMAKQEAVFYCLDMLSERLTALSDSLWSIAAGKG